MVPSLLYLLQRMQCCLLIIIPSFFSLLQKWNSSRHRISLYAQHNYYDPRQRNGHINATVFLIEVIKHLRNKKSIVGCGVGNKVTTNLSIRGEITQRYTHDVTIVDCFDLPVKSGLRAFIWYKIKRHDSQTADVFRVESEQPCFVPTPKQSINKMT